MKLTVEDIDTLKEEILVWKIIRDLNNNFFLVEASLPKGTKYFLNHNSSKIRVNQAKINYITSISHRNYSHLRYALHGDIPKSFKLHEKETFKKIDHSSICGQDITYTLKLMKTKFSNSPISCVSGLHFFLQDKIKDVKISWV